MLQPKEELYAVVSTLPLKLATWRAVSMLKLSVVLQCLNSCVMSPTSHEEEGLVLCLVWSLWGDELRDLCSSVRILHHQRTVAP